VWVDALIVEPVIDHRRLIFKQENSCGTPAMADKMRRLGRFTWFAMEHEDYQCITLPLVEIHIGAGTQGFHYSWYGSQRKQIRFAESECSVHEKNSSGCLSREGKGLIGSIQRCCLG
jgi:hypothetical protein